MLSFLRTQHSFLEHPNVTMQNINHGFSIRCEKVQAEDLRKRAIALKGLEYEKQAKLFRDAARHAEAKALILLCIKNL